MNKLLKLFGIILFPVSMVNIFGYVEYYLTIVSKIGFEDVLNIWRVCSVNVTSEKTNQSESCVFECKVSHGIVEPMKIEC